MEEATRSSKSSGKFMEEERRAAEEKVTLVWISSTKFGFLATLKRFHSISSGGEARQVCEGVYRVKGEKRSQITWSKINKSKK